MKICVVIVWELNCLLEIEEIDLDGLKVGEVLVCIVMISLCYIDMFILLGVDFEGLFFVVLGYEVVGIVEELGVGVILVRFGDYVILFYMFEDLNCFYIRLGKINLCQMICKMQGQGVMLDGILCFFYKGRMIYYYMGISIFSEYIVLLEIVVVKILKQVFLVKVSVMGCVVFIGMGVVCNMVKVQLGLIVVVFGLGVVGMVVIQGVWMIGVSCIIGIDINLFKFLLVKSFGVYDCINFKDFVDFIYQVIIDMIDGGVDYSFECIGNVSVMCLVFECCYKGWGECMVIGVVGVGEEILIWLFQLVMGWVWCGLVFGGVLGWL